MGRAAKFRPEYAEQARSMCRQFGAVDEQLATVFGVSIATLDRWKADHPEFREAIEAGKKAFDTERVETSCLQLCLGYYFQEERFDAKAGVIVRLWKYHHPDPRAIMIWQANRNGWRFPKPPEAPPGDDRPPVTQNALPPGVSEEDGRFEAEARAYLEYRYGTPIDVTAESDAVEADPVTADAGDAVEPQTPEASP